MASRLTLTAAPATPAAPAAPAGAAAAAAGGQWVPMVTYGARPGWAIGVR